MTETKKRIHTAIAEGTKFNHLTVIQRAPNTSDGYAAYQCKCDCGNYTVVKATNLKRGKVKTCGCRMNLDKVNVDKKYGWLTVTEYGMKGHRDRKHYWWCKCRCGNETMVREDNLRKKRTTSCGCKRTYYSKKEREKRKEDAEDWKELKRLDLEWKMTGTISK